jgi:hypothetical protein
MINFNFNFTKDHLMQVVHPHFSVLNQYKNSNSDCAMGILNILSMPVRAVLGGVKVDVVTGERSKGCGLIGKILIVVFCILVAPLGVIAGVCLLVKSAVVTCKNRKVQVESLMISYANHREGKRLGAILNAEIVYYENHQGGGDDEADEAFVNKVLSNPIYADVFSTTEMFVCVIKNLDESVRQSGHILEFVIETLVKRDIESQCEFKMHESHGKRTYECTRGQGRVGDGSNGTMNGAAARVTSTGYKTRKSLEECKQNSLNQFMRADPQWRMYMDAVGQV